MKTGVIVLCRYNSSRLPGKILLEIEGKPVLGYILDRLQKSNLADEIVIATSDQDTDNPIADYCHSNEIPLFRGDLDNVSFRFLDCARKYDFDFAVRVNGDNLFTDAQLIDQAIQLATDENYDFVSNVDQRTYPTGMSVEVVKTDFYRKIYKKFNNAEHYEHVTLFLYQNRNIGKFHFFYNTDFQAAKGLKLALDCKEDLNFISLLLQKMNRPHTSYTWKGIVTLATNEKNLGR